MDAAERRPRQQRPRGRRHRRHPQQRRACSRACSTRCPTGMAGLDWRPDGRRQRLRDDSTPGSPRRPGVPGSSRCGPTRALPRRQSRTGRDRSGTATCLILNPDVRLAPGAARCRRAWRAAGEGPTRRPRGSSSRGWSTPGASCSVRCASSRRRRGARRRLVGVRRAGAARMRRDRARPRRVLPADRPSPTGPRGRPDDLARVPRRLRPPRRVVLPLLRGRRVRAARPRSRLCDRLAPDAVATHLGGSLPPTPTSGPCWSATRSSSTGAGTARPRARLPHCSVLRELRFALTGNPPARGPRGPCFAGDGNPLTWRRCGCVREARLSSGLTNHFSRLSRLTAGG